MFVMSATDQATYGHTHTQADPQDQPPAEVLRQLKASQMAEILDMRAVGSEIMERLGRHASGLLMEREERAFIGDVCLGFTRVTRAIRQIIALEMELTGQRPAPPVRARRPVPVPVAAEPVVADERVEPEQPEQEADDLRESDDLDDYGDYDDYDQGPIDAVLGRVRDTLGMPPKAPEPAMAAPVVTTVAPAAPGVAKPAIPPSGQPQGDGPSPSPSDLPRSRARGHDPP